MRFFAVALAIAATAVGSTSASSIVSRTLASVSHAHSSLLSRQVPTACVGTCSPAQIEITACDEDSACLCTPSIAPKLLACANCRVQHDPTQRSRMEALWDEYTLGCVSINRPVSGELIGSNSTAASVTATPNTPATVLPIATSAAADSTSFNDGGLIAHRNSASSVRGGVLGVFVAGVIAALLCA